jgi:hypothetical protein
MTFVAGEPLRLTGRLQGHRHRGDPLQRNLLSWRLKVRAQRGWCRRLFCEAVWILFRGYIDDLFSVRK